MDLSFRFLKILSNNVYTDVMAVLVLSWYVVPVLILLILALKYVVLTSALALDDSLNKISSDFSN